MYRVTTWDSSGANPSWAKGGSFGGSCDIGTSSGGDGSCKTFDPAGPLLSTVEVEASDNTGLVAASLTGFGVGAETEAVPCQT